jgi:hypothetical protein
VWEIRIPELGISVFEVPAGHVKGRRRSRVLVCNSVAQSVVESVRGQHHEHVFVYRRLKKDGNPGKGMPHPMEQEAARSMPSPPKVPRQEKTP